MKILLRKYIILWVLVLITFNFVVLLIQYMIPSLDIFRGAYIETAKNLIFSTASITDDLRHEATRGLLSFQSTIYGVIVFNALMIIQLILFIITSVNIKDGDDMMLSFPLLNISKKFFILTIIMCLIFSLVRNIPTFIAIVISLVFVIYMFFQYNKYLFQKSYVEDLEKRNREKKERRE